MTKKRIIFIITTIFAFLACPVAPPLPAGFYGAALAASEEPTPESTAQEIEELNKKIEELRQKRDNTAEEAQATQNAIKALERQLRASELELQKTEVTIQKVEQDQVSTQSSIQQLDKDITEKKQQLRQLMRALYQKEQQSLVRVFFDTWSLGEVFTEQVAYAELNERAITVVKEMKERQDTLRAQQQKLEQQATDLEQLETMLASQKSELATQRAQQATILQDKQEEQAGLETLIKEAQQARQEIKNRVFKIEGNAPVELTLNNAYDMARHAHKLTGVRPALLLGVLKVESNVGQNIGNGTFPGDMHPGSREAFVRITKKLNLDPHTAQISRRPASGKGWGGAMGPAQIMPATWESIEPRLEQLLGKSPVNPYELTDAFVATAVFLADRGAANPASEREAVGRYIAGPNWQYYGWYIDKVMAVAQEYEKDGL